MWYIYRYGQQFGPISEAEFQSLSDRKQISPTDLVWRELPGRQYSNQKSTHAEPSGQPERSENWREVEARGLGQSTAARPTGWRYAFQYEAGHALCAW